MILICCLLLVGPFYFMFYLVKCYLCIWGFFSLYCTATYVPYTPCLKFISAADGFRGWQTCFLIFFYVFVLLYSNFLCFSESFLSQNLVHCTAHLFGLIRKKMHTNLTQSSIALKGMLTSSLQMKRLFHPFEPLICFVSVLSDDLRDNRGIYRCPSRWIFCRNVALKSLHIISLTLDFGSCIMFSFMLSCFWFDTVRKQ